MKLFIDDREKDRIKPALDYFTENGIDTEVKQLLYGDYVFTDNNITVAFEYKTIEDYIHSLKDNRVFNQAINQSNHFDYHFVIIEGTEKDRTKIIKKNHKYTGRYLSLKEYYGGFASLVNFTSVIQSPNMKTSFLIMERFSIKCCNDKPIVKRFSKSKGSPAFRLLCNNVNRVGYITAERICNELDLQSIHDVFDLTVDDLVSVDGVGKVTAVSILKQLNSEFGG